MSAPRSVRFDDDVLARLDRRLKSLPGASTSALVNRMVDEALRMEDHPGIQFRGGPAGRRAALVAGPDVWEVIGAYRAMTASDPDQAGDTMVDELAEVTGTAATAVLAALRYYGAHTAEIDAWIASNEEVAEHEERLWRAQQQLLRRAG